MKTILTVVAVAILAMGFTGCSDRKKVDTKDPKSPYYIDHNDNVPMP